MKCILPSCVQEALSFYCPLGIKAEENCGRKKEEVFKIKNYSPNK